MTAGRAKLDRDIAQHVGRALKSPRLKLLGYVTGLPVYLVSGELVRNTIDIDFTQGGNEAAYPSYVPKGEIWIDDAMHALDRAATTFHEIVERNLVLFGGIDYDDAHEVACKREIELRKRLRIQMPAGVGRPVGVWLRLVEAALAPFASEAVNRGKKPGKPSRIP